MTDQARPEFQKPPSDKAAWDRFWNDYCKHKGHRFVNRRCIYCSAWEDELKENSDG